MIAVDTNILIYAHRRDSSFHEAAAEVVRALAETGAPWAIPWACLHEVYSIITHPRIFDPPSTSEQARAQIAAWLACPTLEVLSETSDHWTTLDRLLEEGRIEGPRVHDARIAAICLTNGVRELYTADRDFTRFPDLASRNPLI